MSLKKTRQDSGRDTTDRLRRGDDVSVPAIEILRARGEASR